MREKGVKRKRDSVCGKKRDREKGIEEEKCVNR